jgi:hypothetical protein
MRCDAGLCRAREKSFGIQSWGLKLAQPKYLSFLRMFTYVLCMEEFVAKNVWEVSFLFLMPTYILVWKHWQEI